MRMSHATGGLLSDLCQRGRGGASLHSVITDGCAGMARVPEAVCPRARQRLKWVARGGIFSKTCVGVMKNKRRPGAADLLDRQGRGCATNPERFGCGWRRQDPAMAEP